jgi:hypothetical protein
MTWIRQHGLSIVLLALFIVFLAAQTVAGWMELNDEARAHARETVTLGGYFLTGHFWEATFENWESEFLQMAAFVVLTTFLYHVGSSESRRPGVVELVDADPRDFTDEPDVPWPVRRGGWILRVYENSLGLAFGLLFLLSWAGHAIGGWRQSVDDGIAHGQAPQTLAEYVSSARFWFESFQNWQSEFLAIAAMVWLSVYLRQRHSPESKPVHAPHTDTGR